MKTFNKNINNINFNKQNNNVAYAAIAINANYEQAEQYISIPI